MAPEAHPTTSPRVGARCCGVGAAGAATDTDAGGGGVETTTAGVGVAAVTGTATTGAARLMKPTGRPRPRLMAAPTADAGV